MALIKKLKLVLDFVILNPCFPLTLFPSSVSYPHLGSLITFLASLCRFSSVCHVVLFIN